MDFIRQIGEEVKKNSHNSRHHIDSQSAHRDREKWVSVIIQLIIIQLSMDHMIHLGSMVNVSINSNHNSTGIIPVNYIFDGTTMEVKSVYDIAYCVEHYVTTNLADDFLFGKFNDLLAKYSHITIKTILICCVCILFFEISADTPFSQVKLGEFGAWLGRRNKTPRALSAACSRMFWRWQHKYCQTKRVGVAPFFQFVGCTMALFYVFNYERISEYREIAISTI